MLRNVNEMLEEAIFTPESLQLIRLVFVAWTTSDRFTLPLGQRDHFCWQILVAALRCSAGERPPAFPSKLDQLRFGIWPVS